MRLSNRQYHQGATLWQTVFITVSTDRCRVKKCILWTSRGKVVLTLTKFIWNNNMHSFDFIITYLRQSLVPKRREMESCFFAQGAFFLDYLLPTLATWSACFSQNRVGKSLLRSPEEKVALLTNLFSFNKRFPYEYAIQIHPVGGPKDHELFFGGREHEYLSCYSGNVVFSLYVCTLAF